MLVGCSIFATAVGSSWSNRRRKSAAFGPAVNTTACPFGERAIGDVEPSA